MPIVDITAVRPEHLEQLAAVMRPGDLDECIAAGYPDARSALEDAMAHSTHSWAVLFDGEVAALVGLDGDYTTKAALVWALTGRAVDRARLSFVRASRALLALIRSTHPFLFNIVDARYQGAVDWLEVLGFKLGPVVPHPRTGQPFRVAVIGGV